MSATRTVVLLRHGHSEWNLSNRFTGWTDIPLTEQGLAEAKSAGRLLKTHGFAFDEVHVSALQRTTQTASALLAAANHPPAPIHPHWRLNERHYGALQGMNKSEIFAAWGETQAHKWWRGYHDRPPPLAETDPRHPRFDPLYRELDPALLPASESLADCQQRTLALWQDSLLPHIQQGRRLLIVSHGNTLRGLVMHLEKLNPVEVEQVEIPPGIPLIYRFDSAMQLQEHAQLE